MGYPISAKAVEIAHNLADNLLQRGSAGALATAYSGPVPVVESFGATSGLPLISFGTLTSTSQGALIRVQLQTILGTDVLGNTQPAYTPHTIQVAIEAAADGVMQLAANAPLLQTILALAVQTGCQVQLIGSASGSTVTETTLAAGTVEATFDGLNQYPLTGSM